MFMEKSLKCCENGVLGFLCGKLGCTNGQEQVIMMILIDNDVNIGIKAMDFYDLVVNPFLFIITGEVK